MERTSGRMPARLRALMNRLRSFEASYGLPVSGWLNTSHRLPGRPTPEAGLEETPHTFATLASRSGVSMRTLMESMGHSDLNTTLVYADFAPSTSEAERREAAFTIEAGINPGINLSDPEEHSATSEAL
jgi:integrase